MTGIFVVLVLITIAFGGAVGFIFRLSFAMKRADKRRSLRFDASSASERTARALVGVNQSGWM
jgi:hypothetical protein